MSAGVRQEWARAEDRAWAERLRMRLVSAHGAPARVVDDVLAEVRRACAETGQPAEDLFGPDRDYATEVAEERIPVEVRAAADLDGSAPRDHWRALAFSVGGPGVVLCLLIAAREGWSVGLTPGALVLLAAVVGAMGLAAWGQLERHAGDLRRAWALWATATVVLVGGAGAATTLRGQAPLGTVSLLVPLAASVLLLVVAPRLPQRSAPEVDWPALAADAWFDRLAGVLRGRYYLPRADVARHVAEARAFAREVGAGHPYGEFGAPDVYALRLVQGSQRPFRGRRRVLAWGRTALAALWLGLVVATAVQGGTTADWLWRLGGLALFATLAWRAWRHQDDRTV